MAKDKLYIIYTVPQHPASPTEFIVRNCDVESTPGYVKATVIGVRDREIYIPAQNIDYIIEKEIK